MKETAKDRKSELYEHLKTSILTFRILPGENLDEAQLSKTFGLSRTPLREVFRQLAGDGYVEIRANRGAKISANGIQKFAPHRLKRGSGAG
jgi:DNA-binding GntR family transcriptional regulator